MKHLRHLFTALLLLLVSVAANAQGLILSDENELYWYEITDAKNKTVSVFFNRYYIEDVEIPESIEYNGDTYSVTSIRNEAFANFGGITSIVIPNSVTII